jgi:hypothetical protein
MIQEIKNLNPPERKESLAEELERLVKAGGSEAEEAWNLIADFAVDNSTEICHALTASAQVMQWQPPELVPPVEGGQEGEFIVAVYRARTGKVYTFSCSYLSAFRILYDDCPRDKVKQGLCDDCSEDGCSTTGWFYLTGDGNNESGCYQTLLLRDGDKIVGWQELPKWTAAPPSTDGKPPTPPTECGSGK